MLESFQDAQTKLYFQIMTLLIWMLDLEEGEGQDMEPLLVGETSTNFSPESRMLMSSEEKHVCGLKQVTSRIKSRKYGQGQLF